MNLKEAFRFQNKLQSMMADAQSILGNNGNITKVQNTYLRHKVMAEAEDEVTMEAPSTEYSENITEMAEFLLFLLDEREKLSAAIHQAKVSLPLGAGLDGEVSLNGKRQEIATLLRHMAGLRNGEVLISNGGVGYRFNNEGNQVSYRCDVKRVTTINFDRNKIRKMCADLSKKSDETSAALDAALVNTPVEYEAPFDVNETFAEAFEAHIQLSKLSSIQIQRFYNDLHTQGRLDNHGNRKYEPLSASTVKHIHAVLSGALKQAVKERIIPFNPCDNCKIPKREKKEMHVLPQDKIGAYLDEAKRLGVYALFYLELTSGLRRGELLGLEWADLNPETRMLTVNKQLTRSGGELRVTVPKTENSIRTIALPENTVAVLIEEHNKHPDSPLMFWCPRTNGYWSPDSLRHLHKQMLAAAGVDESVRFHDLRHTFSTLAIQSGVDAKTVAGMLGHYSAAFTLDTYTHVTEQMKRGAAEKIGVFMNASVNVQVNVVHSPSAVVRGDYESDLANCLNPSNSTDLDPTSQ